MSFFKGLSILWESIVGFLLNVFQAGNSAASAINKAAQTAENYAEIGVVYSKSHKTIALQECANAEKTKQRELDKEFNMDSEI